MAQPARTPLGVLLLATIILVQAMVSGYMLRPAYASDLSFQPVKNLSNDPFVSDTPEIATAGSNVYVTWQNSTATSNNNILFTASHDNATTFGPVINLSKGLLHGNSVQQQIVAVGSYVYVVWKDNTTGTDNMYFSASNNTGQSFVAPIPLSLSGQAASTKPSGSPGIAVSVNYVYLIWIEAVNNLATQFDVFFAVSQSNGKTGTFTVTNLSNDKTVEPLPAGKAVVAATGSDVYVAWQDTSCSPACGNILLKASNNNGVAFGSVQNLSNFLSGSGISVFSPQIGATGIDVYLTWVRDTTLTDDVYFSLSTNSGLSFGAAVNLSQDLNSFNPGLAASGNNVYVIWADKTTSPNTVVKLRSSNNNGASFASIVTISSTTGLSPSPQITAAGSNSYVAWQDLSAANNLFFRSSGDAGATFGNIVNLSQDINSQTFTPALAANGNNVYVAWPDDSGRINPDILFRTTVPVKITFTLNALYSGWNSTLPPGTTTPCSPTGTTGCNPAITRFRDKAFTVQVLWKDSSTHQFALYTKGFPAGSVTPSDQCNLTSTNGCLAQSAAITQSSPSALLTFTPTIPADFPASNGPGTYEYYCKYHPSTMHGQITVYKNPDIDGDGKVTIVDAAYLAFYFDLNSSSPQWNQPPQPASAADLDNNGKITIVDAAILAFYFDQTI